MFGLFKQRNFMDDLLQQSKFFSLFDTLGVLYNMSNGKRQNLISSGQNVSFSTKIILTTSIHDWSFPNRFLEDLFKASWGICFSEQNIFDCLAFILLCPHHSTQKCKHTHIHTLCLECNGFIKFSKK